MLKNARVDASHIDGARLLHALRNVIKAPAGALLYIGWFLQRRQLTASENEPYRRALNTVCRQDGDSDATDRYNCVFQDDLLLFAPTKLRDTYNSLGSDLRAHIDYFIFTQVVETFVSEKDGSSFTTFVNWWRTRHDRQVAFLNDDRRTHELQSAQQFPPGQVEIFGEKGDVRFLK